MDVEVHPKNHTVCLMDSQDREIIPRLTVDNTPPGTEAFIRQIAQQMVTSDFEAIRVAAEATGWYWWHLTIRLSETTSGGGLARRGSDRDPS
ncbi:MAG: IS110 family transposase [Anaerolineae bacterium]|nr:IS110 family transposase [Anaerolineae bacterium]